MDNQLDLLISTLTHDLRLCDTYIRKHSQNEIGAEIMRLNVFFSRKLRYAIIIRNIRDKSKKGGDNE